MPNDAVYAKLVEVARAKKTISYGELGQVGDVSLDGEDGVKALGLVLDAIADQEIAAGRPLLPVVVVRENNMPGAGLFKYAKRKKLQKTDDLTFFASELNRVYAHWAEPKTVSPSPNSPQPPVNPDRAGEAGAAS